MHPLLNDLSNLKDAELEQKIFDLGRKYFMTNNVEVRQQMSMVLDGLKSELGKRRQAQLDKMMNTKDKTLDNLIKVN
jgi:hypothetical protein